MTMLKNLPNVDMTAVAAQAAVKLGETPFFPGGNCILNLDEPIGGAGVLLVEGSADGSTNWSTLATLNAATTAPLHVEISPNPLWIRTRVTTVGTGTLSPTLEGIQ